MAGVLDLLTGDLPPTATYCRRSWVWIPGGPDGRLGTLTISLQKGERRGRRTVAIESDSYAVDWDTEPLTGVMGRALLLANETDPEAAEVYRVVCAARGGRATARRHCAGSHASTFRPAGRWSRRADSPARSDPCAT